MKDIAFLLVAFIAVSVYSTLNASSLHAQTSVKKKYAVTIDTAHAKAASSSFAVQLLEDSSTEKFILVINNPLSERLSITVRSQSGEGYNETTSLMMVRKRFDFSAAE